MIVCKVVVEFFSLYKRDFSVFISVVSLEILLLYFIGRKFVERLIICDKSKRINRI